MRYALYYHPIPFRGHFVRYALAAAGQDWDEPAHDQVMALKAMAPDAQPYPFMAPPVLHDRDTGLWLSQMPAIVMHLGRSHGLSLAPDLELRLLCDASDVLLEITRHHGAAMWQASAWHDFRTQRLTRWLAMHDRLVRENGLDRGNGAPGLAGLVLAALWHTMAEGLPPLRPTLETGAPALMAMCDRVAARPPIAALCDTWRARGPVYCGGQIEASLREVLATT